MTALLIDKMIICYTILSVYLYTCTLSTILWQSFDGNNDNSGWSSTAGNSALYDSYDSSCPYGNSCWKLCGSCCGNSHTYTRSSVSTVGYTNIRLTFDYNSNGVSNFDANRYCQLQWSSDNWSNSHNIFDWDDGNSAQTSFQRSGSYFTGAEEKTNFAIRLKAGLGWSNSDCCYFSRFILKGTPIPTQSPTQFPTQLTINPSTNPTITPTKNPTISPTKFPTKTPTVSPIKFPTISPSVVTTNPTISPSYSTINPTVSPTIFPSVSPSKYPTKTPSINPTKYPSNSPTMNPTDPQGVVGEETTQDGGGHGKNQNLQIDGKKTDSLLLLVVISVFVFLMCILCILCIVFFRRKKYRKNKMGNFNKQNMETQMEMEMTNSNIVVTTQMMDLHKINSISNSHVIPTVSPVPSQNDEKEHQFTDTLTHLVGTNQSLIMTDIINAVHGVTDDGSNALNQINDEYADSSGDDEEILQDINTYKTGGGPLVDNDNDDDEILNGVNIYKTGGGTPSDHADVLDDVIANDEQYMTKGADQGYNNEFIVDNDDDDDIGPHTLK
eukprot:203244_1